MTKTLTSKILLTAAAAVLLAGCGSKVNQVALDTSSSASTGTAVAALSTDPATSGVTPVANQLTAASTTPAAAATMQDITATVTTKKNGVFLGMGTFKCTVEVSNPSSVPRHGVLTVTFMNKTKQSKTAPETRPVTLLAGESRSYDFSDPKWTTNDVTATFVTAPVASATATAAPAAGAAATTAGAAPSTAGLPTTTY